MKNQLMSMFALLFFAAFLFNSCRSDDSNPGSEIPTTNVATETFIFNNDSRTFPLKSNPEQNYSYYAGWTAFPASQTQPERINIQMVITDRGKNYIGDLGGYTGTSEFNFNLFIPKMIAIGETPVTVPLKSGFDTSVTSTHATLMVGLWKDSSTGLANCWPVTGQSVSISKKGASYIVDIPYLKFQDNFGKTVIMSDLKFETVN